MVLKIHRKNSAIVMTSRIRLARNLAHTRFSNAASCGELAEVFEKCADALEKLMRKCGGTIYPLSSWADYTDMIVVAGILAIGIRSFFLQPFMLVEERHATRELAGATENAGVYISKDGAASAMINEEDHLRIQAVAKGQRLNAL